MMQYRFMHKFIYNILYASIYIDGPHQVRPAISLSKKNYYTPSPPIKSFPIKSP